MDTKTDFKYQYQLLLPRVVTNSMRWFFLYSIVLFFLNGCEFFRNTIDDIADNIAEQCQDFTNRLSVGAREDVLPARACARNDSGDVDCNLRACILGQCNLRDTIFTVQSCTDENSEPTTISLLPATDHNLIWPITIVRNANIVIEGETGSKISRDPSARPFMNLIVVDGGSLTINRVEIDGMNTTSRGVFSRGDLQLNDVTLKNFNHSQGAALRIVGNFTANNLILEGNQGGPVISIRPSLCAEDESFRDVCERLNPSYRIVGFRAQDNPDGTIEYEDINTSITIQGTESHHLISGNDTVGIRSLGSGPRERAGSDADRLFLRDLAFRDNDLVVFQKLNGSAPINVRHQNSRLEIADNERVVFELEGSEQYMLVDNSTIANNTDVEIITRDPFFGWLDFDHSTIFGNGCFKWTKFWPGSRTERFERIVDVGDDNIVFNNSACTMDSRAFEVEVFENNVATNPFDGPLQNNGGFTRTLLPGASRAEVLDQIETEACTPSGLANRFDYNGEAFDQRGLPRPETPGGRCDRGAVERQEAD